MPVPLEPPLTRSLGQVRRPGERVERPLTHGPAVYLSRGGGRSPQPRWHRIRSGLHFPEHTALDRPDLYRDGKPHHTGAYTCWHAWCGPTVHVGNGHPPVLTGDRLPDGTPFALCGPCEGRAVGAGHPPLGVLPVTSLVFSPRRLDPPGVCPGSRKHWTSPLIVKTEGDWRHMQCLVCDSQVRCWGDRVASHPSTERLVPGCPQHAWQSLIVVEEQVVCACRAVYATDRDMR